MIKQKAQDKFYLITFFFSSTLSFIYIRIDSYKKYFIKIFEYKY